MFDIDHLYLASYNYGKINETVVTGGDNFEVTVGLSKTEGLTEEQLEQNGLLDCMMTLLKDVENSINCLYRSIDNDTDLAESLSKQLPISKSNKHLAYNFGTLHEQVERRNDYINGKKGIGPFALNVTNQMLTYLFGVKFKDTNFTKFTGIWRLDHLVDDNDAYISSWLSAFINANVDIVKDPWVVRLNVNPFTYNILNLLVRSGMGQTGVWFLCQPIIRELANVEERTKSNFSKDPSLPKYKFKQKLIEQVLDKYLIQHDDATISEYTTNSDAQSIQSRIEVVNLILDNKEALRYIAVNPNATMVKLNDGSDVSVSWFQGQIYYAFLSLQKYIQAMNKLVQYTKIDTRKHGKNFIQIQRYLAMYNELFHPQDTSKSLWDLESLTNLANNSWIEYKTVNAINLPLRILANQVYTANPEFSSVVLHFARRLARSANDEYGFTEDLIKKLSNGLQTAIKARYMSAYAKQVLGRSDEYIRELFYGSSPLISIARRLNGLKYAVESVPEFERLKGNYIIEKLRPQPQQESVALSDGSVARQPQFITIDSNIDGSRTDENMMVDAWKDLLNDPNERVRMFAEDLILYTFFTTGESKGWNKLFKYVPSAWIRGEIRGGNVDVDGIQCTSFSDYVEQTLNGRMPDLIPMLQEVVSNNFLNYGICTMMQLKNEDGIANFINPDASSPVLVANAVSKSDIDSMPLYISVKKPNTKGRKAGSYNVYKMTGEINATNGVYPIYTMIEKRGYSQFNNDIYEYGIDLQYKENETKIPNASAEEIESRISDACEKIENTGKQGHKWTWNEILIDLTGAFYGESANDDVATDEQSSVHSNPSVIHQYKGVWTRSEVQNDTNSLYIFTDNTDRDSGSGLIDPNSRYAQKYGQGKHYPTRTQAVIRGLDNAMPISTQHWYHTGAKGPTGVWTDNDFEEFKKTIDAEIQDIIDEWNTGKYKRIVIGDGDAFFNSSISNISVKRVPKLYSYLKSKVEELYRYVDKHKPESQPSQATSGIKYESDGGVSVEDDKSNKQVDDTTTKQTSVNQNDTDQFGTPSEQAATLNSDKTILTNAEILALHPFTGNDTRPRIAVASEHTDPAFFSKMIQNWAKGEQTFLDYKKQPIKYEDIDALYLITKHDGLPMRELLQLDKPKIIHFSVTTLGNTKWEPGVMKWQDVIERIGDFIKQGLDPEYVTLRIDPIVPGVTVISEVDSLMKRASELGIKHVRFSVLDYYSTTAKFMENLGFDYSKYFDRNAQGVYYTHARNDVIEGIAKKMLAIAKKYNLDLSTCAEPCRMDGISIEGCLSVNAINSMLGTHIPDRSTENNKFRALCTCYGGKTDLLRYDNKCASSCVYCYAHHNGDKMLNYYNEDGTLKQNRFTDSGLSKSEANNTINTKQIEDSGLTKQSATQPIETGKTPKNYQKYIDVIQKYFDIGYTTGRIGKDDAKQVIQKLHIHIDENSELFDVMKINNLSETDLLNALYLLASHRDKPKAKGRTKLSDQQIDKLLDDMENNDIHTDIFDTLEETYHITGFDGGIIVDSQLMSNIEFLFQNKKYMPIYEQILEYAAYNGKIATDIIDMFNIDNIDLSYLIQVDSTFDNVNQLELFSDKDFEQGRKNKENCKGK